MLYPDFFINPSTSLCESGCWYKLW